MEGGPSVEDAVLDRVIRVTSIAAMEAYSAPVGFQFSLADGGRSGTFLVQSGLHPTDTYKGVYIDLANGNYAVRQYGQSVTSFPVLRASWFGVVGDNATDNAPIINAVINFATAGSGLEFDTGDFRFESTIAIDKRLRFFGNGAAPIDKNDSTGTRFVKAFDGTGILAGAADGIILEDLSVDRVGADSGVGVWLTGSRPTLNRVRVYQQGSHGILVGDPAASTNVNLFYLSNLRSDSNDGDGIRISSNEGGTDNANAGTAIMCGCSNNGGDGLHIGNSRHNVIVNITAEANTGRGVYLSPSAKETNLFGGDTDENNTGGNVLIEGIGTKVFGIPNGGFTDNGSFTIRLQRNASALDDLSVTSLLSQTRGNAGGIDENLRLTSAGNSATGRGPAIAFHLPTGGSSALGAQIAAVRDAADESSRLSFYTKTDAGSIDEVLQLDKPGFGILINLDGTLKRVTLGAADSGGAGFKVLRIPN
jgi:hypothetical protein